jgi:hypothetical protein
MLPLARWAKIRPRAPVLSAAATAQPKPDKVAQTV